MQIVIVDLYSAVTKSLIIYADGSRVSIAIAGVILSVCLSAR